MQVTLSEYSTRKSSKFLNFLHLHSESDNGLGMIIFNGVSPDGVFLPVYKNVKDFFKDVMEFVDIMYDDIILFYLTEPKNTLLCLTFDLFDELDNPDGELTIDIAPYIKIFDNGIMKSYISLCFSADGRIITKKITKNLW